MLSVNTVPSEQLLCLYHGAVAITVLTWQLAAFFHVEVGLTACSFFEGR